MKLTISEPCNENWNKMTPTEKGRFCGSCQKEVTDFSTMTKVEIKDFFIKKATDNTCGRFGKQQLEEFNLPEIKSLTPNYKPWWIAAATFFMFANQVYSQGEAESNNTIELEVKKSFAKNSNENKGDKKDSIISVSGIVVDSVTKEVLPFVPIHCGNNLHSVTTNINGVFEYEIPQRQRDSIMLKINFVGYKSKNLQLQNIENSIELDTIFLQYSDVILGDFTVIDYTTTGLIDLSVEVVEPKKKEVAIDSTVYISGVLMDATTGESLSFATVIIEGTKIGVTSDFEGKFNLLIPKEFQDSLTITISFLGYHKKNIFYKQFIESKNIGIVLFQEHELHIAGGLYYKPTFKDKVKGFFYRLFH